MRLLESHQYLIFRRYGSQRMIIVRKGISVVKVIIILFRQRRIARIVPQHQSRIVIGRLVVDGLLEYVVVVGSDLSRQRRGCQHGRQQNNE